MSPEQSEQSTGRSYVLLAVKIGVSLVLLAILFSKIDAARLWSTARRASLPWLSVALVVYFLTVVACTWRWRLLLDAQDINVSERTLLGSFLVALFFNNFLPSNIGGDVIRIRDTARPSGSKTVATIVVLTDRVLGLMGLGLVAALGATLAAAAAGRGPAPILPTWLWAGLLVGAGLSAPVVLSPAGVGRILQPLTVFHPEWVGGRIEYLTAALARFRERPGVLAACFAISVFVQAMLVVVYIAVAYALRIDVTPWDLAVIVPISFVVQMLPVSVNGFGVREATFSFYFTRIGLPIESALLVSLVSTAVIMLFSLSGAAVYVARGRREGVG